MGARPPARTAFTSSFFAHTIEQNPARPPVFLFPLFNQRGPRPPPATPPLPELAASSDALLYVLITAHADFIQNSDGEIHPMPTAGVYSSWTSIHKLVSAGPRELSPLAIFHSFSSFREASAYWKQVFGDAPLPNQPCGSMDYP